MLVSLWENLLSLLVMARNFIFLLCFMGLIAESGASTIQSRATGTQPYNYNYMYPYMNNQMRTELDPGTYRELNNNPINSVVKTIDYKTKDTRRVIPRQQKTGTTNTARSATGYALPAQQNNTDVQPTSTRRIVSRNATPKSANARSATRRVVARSARGDASYKAQSAAGRTGSNLATATPVSSSRCMADYMECMNGYCQRENTAYNRCYCSAKLSQIDSVYQPAINNLVTQIIKLRNTGNWTDAEMDEYWMSTVGKYTGDNSWTKIDDALNIDWATTESRVRGQQAFATGHEYCVQHLRGCYYMASNLRDAYRSDIARDCAAYEKNLQKIKNIAESMLEAYK